MKWLTALLRAAAPLVRPLVGALLARAAEKLMQRAPLAAPPPVAAPPREDEHELWRGPSK